MISRTISRTVRHLWKLVPVVFALAIFVGQAASAAACGGLVAPNGSVRLERATTLVAWHDGIEHYLTSFTYQGDFNNVGWIVPLPAIPMSIKEGGAWTLQRLERETHPLPTFAVDGAFGAAAPSAAQVIEQVKVEALNITVLKGSGQEVIDWCAANNFTLNAETKAHLLGYAHGSPIFMAAKYDTSAARARHQLQGDGAPVLITMRTPRLWVPLEVLAVEGQPVNADLYLLTDKPVNTSVLGATIGQSAVGSQVPGAPGFQLAFQEQMNPTLYHDLSTDRNMGWVPSNAWLTYLTLNSTEPQVTYDLSLSSAGVIELSPFGTSLATFDRTSRALPGWVPQLPLGTPQTALLVGIIVGLATLLVVVIRRGERRPAPATRTPNSVD
ncbi:MAG TPA: DUF2330 domain-containing protein [Ktedonobacterales bacterium]|nr:DUF2330 domain-containing protein [Ktedonobacterales bacterium]